MEKWKDIKGFEGLYQVSTEGRIRSVFREGTKGGIIKQFIPKNCRYIKVRIYKNGKQYNFYTHRLVAQAFLLNRFDKKEINHKNGDRYDNRVVNLEWCSRSENMDHAYKTGLKKTKMVSQLLNGVEIKIYLNANRASKETGIAYSTIYWCLAGVYKQAGGYEWKYV